MYRAVSMLVAEEVADDVAALLIEQGADGVEIEDRSVLLMPGKTPPPEGQARLIAYCSPEALDARLALAVDQFVGAPVPTQAQPVPDQDWNEVWKSHFAPLAVSERLWVCPSWRLGETPPGKAVLVLDPGMAFGTGTHATTALCLRELDRLLAKTPGVALLDVGCGSGILGIAGKLLGAARVVGLDNDPVAVRVARENAEVNQVELELSTSSLDGVGGPFGLVVSNIMASTLIDLAPLLARQVAPQGTLLLSGVLDFQADDVERAFVSQALGALGRRTQDEWVLLSFSRR